MEAQEIINQIGVLSYSGIWILAFLSNAVVPVPEEVVLLVLGYLSGGHIFNIWIIIPIFITGLFTSDIIIFTLARRGSKFLQRIYNKFFASRVEGREEWIDRHMIKIIFFARVTIYLRFLGPFLAGQKRVPYRKFLFWDFLALIFYVPFYLFIGMYFRSRIESIIAGVGVLENIILAIIMLVVLFFLVRFVRRYIRKNHIMTSRISRKIYQKFVNKLR